MATVEPLIFLSPNGSRDRDGSVTVSTDANVMTNRGVNTWYAGLGTPYTVSSAHPATPPKMIAVHFHPNPSPLPENKGLYAFSGASISVNSFNISISSGTLVIDMPSTTPGPYLVAVATFDRTVPPSEQSRMTDLSAWTWADLSWEGSDQTAQVIVID